MNTTWLGKQYPRSSVLCGLFLCADLACDAAEEGAFFGTDFPTGAVMVILPAHSVSWKAEAGIFVAAACIFAAEQS